MTGTIFEQLLITTVTALILMSPFVLTLLWLVHGVRMALFYLYLWQLKEYHIGRFLDYLGTEKGTYLLWNKAVLFKLCAFIAISGFVAIQFIAHPYGREPLMKVPAAIEGAFALTSTLFIVGVLGMYSVEFLLLFLKKLVRPTFTLKIRMLVILILGALVILLCAGYLLSGYVYSLAISKSFFASIGTYIASLLLIDLLFPVIASAVVLAFQPLTVVSRNRIIQKAREKRSHFEHLTVVGITGSYGKTSTKEFLFHILKDKFSVVKTPEHQNSEIGIAKTILQDLSPQHTIFIAEMGAYNKGGIQLLSNIVRPTMAILTGANEQHLATFGSMEHLLSAEGGKELVQALLKGGTVIANTESKYLREQIGAYSAVFERTYITCSLSNTSAVWAEGIAQYEDRIEFTLNTQEGGTYRCTAPVLGAHNVQNILLAATAAHSLGMEWEEIVQRVSSLLPELGAMRLEKTAGGYNVINSTYSANPDGVMAALEYLSVWPGEKAIVMPCLIELGSASSRVHYEIGKKIARVCNLAVIVSGDYERDIRKGAREGGMADSSLIVLDQPHDIAAALKPYAKASDAVLLEGRISPAIIQAVYTL